MQICEFRETFWRALGKGDSHKEREELQNAMLAAAQDEQQQQPPSRWRPLRSMKFYLLMLAVLGVGVVANTLAAAALAAAVARAGDGFVLRVCVGTLYLTVTFACAIALTCTAAFSQLINPLEALGVSKYTSDEGVVRAWQLAYATPALRAALEQCMQREQAQPQQRQQQQQQQQQQQHLHSTSQRLPLPPPPPGFRKSRELWTLLIPLMAMAPYILLFPTLAADAFSAEPGAESLSPADVPAAIISSMGTVASNMAFPLVGVFASQCVACRALVSPLDFDRAPPGLSWRDWLLFMCGRDIPHCCARAGEERGGYALARDDGTFAPT
ncbi:hypothetical protein JKP88DRAFT_287927 [Tribonema minus]|uniref:Uncharacterized protein n=1 Tax=Tribonema minus TaxID=303371 RepID=A0A835Z863_9STRA|nr:hypothetical protein JKP88DRAFT_287927 [Tribonema minus]